MLRFKMSLAIILLTFGLFTGSQIYGQEQGQWKGQRTIPVPECVETISPTKVILHTDVLVDECSGYRGLIAIAKNTLYFEKLGYEVNQKETTFTKDDNKGDSIVVLELKN